MLEKIISKLSLSQTKRLPYAIFLLGKIGRFQQISGGEKTTKRTQQQYTILYSPPLNPTPTTVLQTDPSVRSQHQQIQRHSNPAPVVPLLYHVVIDTLHPLPPVPHRQSHPGRLQHPHVVLRIHYRQQLLPHVPHPQRSAES